MEISFSQSQRDPVNLKAHETSCLNERGICTVMRGTMLDVPERLHNFWEEKVTTAKNCIISRLSCSVGPYCAIFQRKIV